MQQISVAFTHYNRAEMLIEAFKQILWESRISEFVISDDTSTDGSFEYLQEYFKDNPKVKLYRNEENLNMSRNKAVAIGLCEEKWVAIWDSDNVFDRSYIDALFNLQDVFTEEDEIYMPCSANPEFIFEKYAGMSIHKGNVKQVVFDPMGNVLFNCCNYVVNRDFYLKTYKYDDSHIASDTINHNKNHLLAGGSFYVVPEMRYIHRVHSGSAFLEKAAYNMHKAEEVRKMILAM